MESRTFDGSFDGTVNGSRIADSAGNEGRAAKVDGVTAFRAGSDPMDSRRPSRRKLVLIVDDEERLRVMMSWFLRKKGFRVLLAGTIDDALRILERFRRPIDLLITDIQLPESSGFDVAEAFAVARPTVPVLFISGALTEQDPELRRRIGPGRAFLAKPFAPRVLETKVRDMFAVSKEVQGAASRAPFRWSAFEAC